MLSNPLYLFSSLYSFKGFLHSILKLKIDTEEKEEIMKILKVVHTMYILLHF